MVKAYIKKLKVIKDDIIKLKASQEAHIQRILEIFENPVTKQIEELISISITCDTYIEKVEILDKVLTQTSLLGSQATIE